jgi:hypothetical protein
MSSDEETLEEELASSTLKWDYRHCALVDFTPAGPDGDAIAGAIEGVCSIYGETRHAVGLRLADALERYKDLKRVRVALWTALGRVVASLPPDNILEHVRRIRPHKPLLVAEGNVVDVDPVAKLVDHALNEYGGTLLGACGVSASATVALTANVLWEKVGRLLVFGQETSSECEVWAGPPATLGCCAPPLCCVVQRPFAWEGHATHVAPRSRPPWSLRRRIPS